MSSTAHQSKSIMEVIEQQTATDCKTICSFSQGFASRTALLLETKVVSFVLGRLNPLEQNEKHYSMLQINDLLCLLPSRHTWPRWLQSWRRKQQQLLKPSFCSSIISGAFLAFLQTLEVASAPSATTLGAVHCSTDLQWWSFVPQADARFGARDPASFSSPTCVSASRVIHKCSEP